MILLEQDHVSTRLDVNETKFNIRHAISYNVVIKGRKVGAEELLHLLVIDYSIQRCGDYLR